jgi:tRNA pseudouridine38-40 synthase
VSAARHDPVGDPIRLRIDLAYDGGPFAGFARQRDQTTVQGTLEGALLRLLGQEREITCAGRTDRGVHALAQVVHLDVDASASHAARAIANLEAMRRRLDREVGPAITIWSVQPVSHAFHARFSAIGRQYRYRLVDLPLADPIRRHDRWLVGAELSVPQMRRGAQWLLGEHDFATFCRKRQDRTTMRRIDEIAITRPAAGRIDLRFAGKAFCHQQVRAMVGCLVEVGQGLHDPAWIGDLLAARDRALAARVSPPQGLTLERVRYGRRWPASPPAAVR